MAQAAVSSETDSENPQSGTARDPVKANPVSPGASNAELALELSRKPYYAAIEDVIKSTAACRADFDFKNLLMLDAIHEFGRVEAACRRLKDILGIMPRNHVLHWRGYLFKLLRDFDDEAYHTVKARLASEYAEHLPWIEKPTDHQHLRPAAPTFVPGSLGWLGEVGPKEFAAVAAHPLHATAPAFDPGMPAWGWEPVSPAEMFSTLAVPTLPSTQSPPSTVEQKEAGAAASSSEFKEGGATASSSEFKEGGGVAASSAEDKAGATGASSSELKDAGRVAGPSERKEEGGLATSPEFTYTGSTATSPGGNGAGMAVASHEHDRESALADSTDSKDAGAPAAILEGQDGGVGAGSSEPAASASKDDDAPASPPKSQDAAAAAGFPEPGLEGAPTSSGRPWAKAVRTRVPGRREEAASPPAGHPSSARGGAPALSAAEPADEGVAAASLAAWDTGRTPGQRSGGAAKGAAAGAASATSRRARGGVRAGVRAGASRGSPIAGKGPGAGRGRGGSGQAPAAAATSGRTAAGAGSSAPSAALAAAASAASAASGKAQPGAGVRRVLRPGGAAQPAAGARVGGAAGQAAAGSPTKEEWKPSIRPPARTWAGGPARGGRGAAAPPAGRARAGGSGAGQASAEAPAKKVGEVGAARREAQAGGTAISPSGVGAARATARAKTAGTDAGAAKGSTSGSTKGGTQAAARVRVWVGAGAGAVGRGKPQPRAIPRKAPASSGFYG